MITLVLWVLAAALAGWAVSLAWDGQAGLAAFGVLTVGVLLLFVERHDQLFQ